MTPRMTAAWVLAATTVGAVVTPGPASATGRPWFPVTVEVWDPPFDTAAPRHTVDYVPLQHANRRWQVCVAIPHLKDAYWLAVDFGLIDEARRLGVGVRLHSAGGYGHLATQRAQVEQCLTQGYDALILSAIHATGLNDLVARWRDAGKPVIDLVNGIDSPRLSARAAVPFRDMGARIGRYLAARYAGATPPVRIAWFPGPEGAAWSADGDTGFRAALDNTPLQVVATRWGDTGRLVQAGLIREVLDADPHIDLIVGTAVTAEAAVDVLRERGLGKRIAIAAYYFGPGVQRAILRGQMLAAPSDWPAITARIALDQAVRLLEGRPYLAHVSPRVWLVDRASSAYFDATTTVAPRGFRAIFSVNE